MSTKTTIDINMDVGRLDNLAQTLADADSSYLKVGVLGDYAGRIPGASGTEREKSDLTNPQLGMWHEFGTFRSRKGVAGEMGPTKVAVPERSFLRMPLWLKLPAAIQAMGNANKWDEFISSNGIVKFLDTVGFEAIGIIRDAFKTGGFGNWKALSKSTISRKGNSVILKETGQLSRSITYAVVARGAPQVSISPVVPQ